MEVMNMGLRGFPQLRAVTAASRDNTNVSAPITARPEDVLTDLVRLHLVSLLDTEQWCRFTYLRHALELSNDRLKRHFYLLRSCGYVLTSRSAIGTGWAHLTQQGATAREAQFAALANLLPAARRYAADQQTLQPDWFTYGKRP
jgi:hypothetical protein